VSVPAAAAVSNAGLDTGDLELSGVSIRMMPTWMSMALGSGIAATTIADTIYVSSDRYERVIAGREPVLLLHELVHVSQWRREGRFAFLFQYIRDYSRNRLIGLQHDAAYRAIGFEAAAYDISERPNRGAI
jgi:hypothetical protein